MGTTSHVLNERYLYHREEGLFFGCQKYLHRQDQPGRHGNRRRMDVAVPQCSLCEPALSGGNWNSERKITFYKCQVGLMDEQDHDYCLAQEQTTQDLIDAGNL